MRERSDGIVNTNRDLNYRLFIQHNTGFKRSPFRSELEGYRYIQAGDVETVTERFKIIRKNFLEGKGTLSDDPVRNIMYHFVTSVALVSRFCVEGGLGHDVAYTLSDIYIQRADKCSDCESLLDIFEEMRIDFAKRMRELKKERVVSLHVRRCIDHIYDHLHEKLTLDMLSEVSGLSSSYLSKLFEKETGVTVKQFIIRAKIQTAENLLKYSDFSYLDIALSLGFSSQSAFIYTFRKQKGMTPKEYREMYAVSEEDFIIQNGK